MRTRKASLVTHCLSPCLSDDIGSQSVKERQQRKNKARVSHNSFFQLVVLCSVVGNRMMIVYRKMKTFGFLACVVGLVSIQEILTACNST